MTNQPPPKKNVLVVEDDPFMQNLYRMVLEREGFTILIAEDGLATIEMLPRMSVDLVVLDLMLPKISGLEVLEAIRADGRHNKVPVIILSNAYLPAVARMAAKAGATEGLLKSEFSPKRLVKLINQLLSPPALPSNTAPEPRNSWISSLTGRQAAVPAPSASKNPIALTVDEKVVASEVHAELMKTWPTDIWLIRQDSLKYQKTAGTQESEELLKRIYSKLRLFSARATMAGCGRVSQLCIAFEAMLFEHGFNLKRSEFPSLFQTMAQAMDCLEYLFKSGHTMTTRSSRKNRILLVDDDAICNKANAVVLARANFETVCADDGGSALAQLESSSFDLILLDVNMPGLTGFEVCTKIRELPQYKQTPIIFVSLNNDFQSRTQSVLCGSNGFISKPISPIELIVKALVFLFRTQYKEAYRDEPVTIAPADTGIRADSETRSASTETPPSVTPAKDFPALQASVAGEIKAAAEPPTTAPSRQATVEQTSVEPGKPQAELEPDLAQCLQVQAPEDGPLVESQQRLEIVAKAGPVEMNQLAKRTRELGVAQSALNELKNELARVNRQVQSLTDSLHTESGLRATAEQKAAELGARRTQLEEELTQRLQMQAQLEAQLAEGQQQREAVTSELDGFRSRASADLLRQQRLFELIHMSEQARVQLGIELNTARGLASSHKASISALEDELQRLRAEHARQGILLQTEVVNRRRLETQSESVQPQPAEATDHLAQECAVEQNLRGHETTLPNNIRNQRLEIAKSSASPAGQQEATDAVGRQKTGLMLSLPAKKETGPSAPEVILIPVISGHGNGNGHANSNGNGHANGHGNGSPNGHRDGDDAGYRFSESRTGSGIDG